MKEEILCISYFDYLIGPSTFYCNESLEDNPDYPDLNKILDFNEEEGSFIFSYRKFQTINHLFFMQSDAARGGHELLMITYMIRAAYFKNEIIDVFKYLDSKIPILEEYASEIKEIEESIGKPVIKTSRGGNERGGSCLTETGEEILKIFEDEKKSLDNYISKRNKL